VVHISSEMECQLFHPLFQTLGQFVWSVGGDGDGVVVCKNYNFQEVGKLFNSWLDSYFYCRGHSNTYKIHETDTSYLITDESNENFLFVKGDEKYTSIWDQIVIYI
jgi:hypothetical protein